MDIAKLEITFPSSLKFVKITVSDILTFIQSNISSFPSEDLFDLRLIYNEILINSVLHGNCHNENKVIHICIVTNHKDLIYSSIEDEGCGFNYNRLLDKLHTSPDLYLESGRGLQLVNALSDRIRFNKHGNKIIFFKRVRVNG